MKAYLEKPKLKELLVEEVKRHQEQDQIIQGTYGKENGKWKGCAVGCSIHSLNIKLGKNLSTNDHSVYETELGIPRAIAKLEDRIFEGLPEVEAKKFPLRFAEAVNVGADLSMVLPKFFIWLLSDPKDGIINFVGKYKKCKQAIETVADLYTQTIGGKIIEKKTWKAAAAYADAAYAADAAADAAYAADAAAAAAYADAAAAAADAAYAADAAAAAAYAATAYAAAYAATAYAYAATAYAAAYAAAAATYAADAADAATYAADAATYAADADAARLTVRENHYIKMADKLIDILKETK